MNLAVVYDHLSGYNALYLTETVRISGLVGKAIFSTPEHQRSSRNVCTSLFCFLRIYLLFAKVEKVISHRSSFCREMTVNVAGLDLQTSIFEAILSTPRPSLTWEEPGKNVYHYKKIIVRKLDYHTSEEPVDLFLTTLVVCTRQQ